MVYWELRKPHWMTAIVYYSVLAITYFIVSWIITSLVLWLSPPFTFLHTALSRS